MKASDAIVDVLMAEGVRHVFTLIDDVILTLIQAFADRDVQVVTARHEQAVVGMADGFARSSGALAVGVVGAGPGLAQTGAALVTACRHRTGLLLLAGHIPAVLRHHVKGFDAAAFAIAAGCAFFPIAKPSDVSAALAGALAHIRVGSGPALVAVSAHVLESSIDEWRYQHAAPARPNLAPPPAMVRQAARLIAAARRPVLLVGAGAVAADAHEAILRLADVSGAALATTLQARGWFDGHPAGIGLMGALASAQGRDVLAGADLLLAIGSSLNPYVLGTAYGAPLLAPAAMVLQIDSHAGRIGVWRSVDLALCGDARTTVEAIANELGSRHVAAPPARSVDTAPRGAPATAQSSTSPVLLDDLLCELDRMLPVPRTVVVDCGLFAFSVVDHIRCAPQAFIWSADFGAVGMGVAMGLGAALAHPERTCCVFVGDGGFTMSPQEIISAVNQGIRIVLVVLDDGAYGAEAYLLAERHQDTKLAQLDNPDLASMARSMGALAATVRCQYDLPDAIRLIDARHAGPVLIHAVIERIVTHRAIP